MVTPATFQCLFVSSIWRSPYRTTQVESICGTTERWTGQPWPRITDESRPTRTHSHDILENQGQKESPKNFQKWGGDKKQVRHKGIEIRRALSFSTAITESRLYVFKFREKVHLALNFTLRPSIKYECRTENYSDMQLHRKKKSSRMYYASESDKMMPSIKTRDKTKKETA